MNRPDPFTHASPTYQAAIRHPHKSGPALEIASAGIRMGPGFLLFAAAVVVCGLLWWGTS
jgi:hypothetical protein